MPRDTRSAARIVRSADSQARRRAPQGARCSRRRPSTAPRRPRLANAREAASPSHGRQSDPRPSSCARAADRLKAPQTLRYRSAAPRRPASYRRARRPPRCRGPRAGSRMKRMPAKALSAPQMLDAQHPSTLAFLRAQRERAGAAPRAATARARVTPEHVPRLPRRGARSSSRRSTRPSADARGRSSERPRPRSTCAAPPAGLTAASRRCISPSRALEPSARSLRSHGCRAPRAERRLPAGRVP